MKKIFALDSGDFVCYLCWNGQFKRSGIEMCNLKIEGKA